LYELVEFFIEEKRWLILEKRKVDKTFLHYWWCHWLWPSCAHWKIFCRIFVLVYFEKHGLNGGTYSNASLIQFSLPLKEPIMFGSIASRLKYFSHYFESIGCTI